jgi:hypothetical protein
MKRTALIIVTLLTFSATYSQSTPKEEIEILRHKVEETGKNINWEEFDATSKVAINKISNELLQGEWKAYDGLFIFGNSMNSMALTIPFTIEFNENKFRRSKDSKFEKFTLNNNKLISREDNSIGLINRITDKLLVISWKNGENYTRYYYVK